MSEAKEVIIVSSDEVAGKWWVRSHSENEDERCTRQGAGQKSRAHSPVERGWSELIEPRN